MKYSWSKTVFPIASIFSFRMLGLFLLIPVFTLYAGSLNDATPTLIGLALGAYGLTQGLLQIPFGILSDKIGRKPMITIGLILFALGSLLGACSHSIYTMIFARTLQGTGAIGSVLIALLADLTPDEQRTKAMAVIGMTIGTSFSLAMIVSPSLTNHYGLTGIFYITSVLAILGLLLLHWVIPSPQTERFHADTEANPKLFKSVLLNPHLQRLNISIFCQHYILTSTFFAIPLLLREQIKLGHLTQQWHFYFPIIVLSFFLMVPFIILAEKKKLMKPVLLFSILITTASQFLLAVTSSTWLNLCALMFTYFIAFNILEASLPSLVSKQAQANNKGTAMGIYSTSQFLGLFAGGALAGLLYQNFNSQGIFILNALLGLIWFLIACFISPNRYFFTLILPYTANQNDQEIIQNLLNMQGVIEVYLEKNEEVLYLRINKALYLPGSAEQLLASSKQE